MARVRIDKELLRRGLVESRSEAAALIDDGRVRVNGAPVDKASRQVTTGDSIQLAGQSRRFVSRGALKLEHALNTFGIDVTGKTCIDVGASTGGFTDCLLQHGAAHVVAIDVGRAQIHHRILTDPRVQSIERLHIRDASKQLNGQTFQVVVADLSFISLASVAQYLSDLGDPSAKFVVLVKPQFEVGRDAVRSGRGVVTDPELWQQSIASVIDAFAAAGRVHHGTIESPIQGAEGNHEFLCWFGNGSTERLESPVDEGPSS